MTTQHHPETTTEGTRALHTTDVVTQERIVTSTMARQALAALRIAFGLTFLWAFFDKLFGLGYATPSKDSWLNGGDPTYGFLKFAADGPFAGFYHSLAGHWWVTWLFMLALVGIGTALTFGIGMRLAGAAGAVLYLMMWTVALPPVNNPVLDEHILGAISVVVLALTLAGDTWGIGKVWAKLPLVERWTALR